MDKRNKSIKNEMEFFKDENGVDKVRIRRVIETEFLLEDRVIDEIPKSCYDCPVGFQSTENSSCGRNVPWTYEDRIRRPNSCKLKSYEEYLREIFGFEGERQSYESGYESIIGVVKWDT